ncbi:hypothetical protein FRAAL3064 [Frankia alni ACN14a]|uniref:Uncharacterized protein n=1 Tax=Frankia alni (strain DSM 45986 / CECT 9034 / ACN14a) TaxID=326424 RepID=Q0RL97_FRAAA|nr:hypothetical protein FRAAL3064 [Frankia alni ACN14a]
MTDRSDHHNAAEGECGAAAGSRRTGTRDGYRTGIRHFGSLGCVYPAGKPICRRGLR